MAKTEPINQELEFNVGEEETEATVEMNEDGSEAQVAAEDPPVVEEVVEKKPAAKKETEDLEQYSDKVKKRIDKLTARLRETQRREEAAVEFAKNVQQQNETLQEKYQRTDTERLQEAQGRTESHVVALKQVIKKAREEGDIDTETEAQQRLTTVLMEQDRIKQTTSMREAQPAQAAQPAPQPQQAPPPPPPRTDSNFECQCHSREVLGQSGAVPWWSPEWT